MALVQKFLQPFRRHQSRSIKSSTTTLLKKQSHGDARKLIQHYDISDGHYQAAWDKLVSRYDATIRFPLSSLKRFPQKLIRSGKRLRLQTMTCPLGLICSPLWRIAFELSKLSRTSRLVRTLIPLTPSKLIHTQLRFTTSAYSVKTTTLRASVPHFFGWMLRLVIRQQSNIKFSLIALYPATHSANAVIKWTVPYVTSVTILCFISVRILRVPTIHLTTTHPRLQDHNTRVIERRTYVHTHPQSRFACYSSGKRS